MFHLLPTCWCPKLFKSFLFHLCFIAQTNKKLETKMKKRIKENEMRKQNDAKHKILQKFEKNRNIYKQKRL